MTHIFDRDICVMGAGPAGCVTARRLVDLGYSVCILEGKAFPRSHVGICLSDETNSVLEYIGVKDAIQEAAFLERKTTVVKWETEEAILAPQPGFHVDRGIFDQILLQNAISAGTTVLQPAKVKSLSPFEEGWKIIYEMAGERKEISTRFVVDATGNSNVLPAKKTRMAPPLFAMHAKWSLEKIPDFDGFIEAGKDAWLWFARINGGKALINLFTDPKHFLQSKSEGLESHYFEMFQQFSLLESCQLGSRISPIESCDASSRCSTDPVGKNYIRVGDANMSVDPIASQGVHLAMTSALQAAIVVNTLLRHPENNKHAIEFYCSRQEERIHQFTERTAGAYQQVSQLNSDPFWIKRAEHVEVTAPQAEPEAIWPESSHRIQLSSQAKIHPMPVMQHEMISIAPALHHPSLKRPIAYLGGKDIISLLGELKQGESAETLISTWSVKMPSNQALEILSWLWSRKIFIPYEEKKKVVSIKKMATII